MKANVTGVLLSPVPDDERAALVAGGFYRTGIGVQVFGQTDGDHHLLGAGRRLVLRREQLVCGGGAMSVMRRKTSRGQTQRTDRRTLSLDVRDVQALLQPKDHDSKQQVEGVAGIIKK